MQMLSRVTKQAFDHRAATMANRLLINIANVVEWLKSGEETNGFYANVVNFLEKAIDILQLAIDDLRGKDIHHTNKIEDEEGIIVTLNDLVDHLDYITYKDGMQMMREVEKARFQLDLARQAIRLGSLKIPEIRENLEKLIDNVEEALTEEKDSINLKTALVRMRGTMHDLGNI